MKLPINFDYLIAEIGGNHEGNVDWALNMISDAAKAGANAVKFQSYSAKELVNPKIDKVRFDHFDKFMNDTHKTKVKTKDIILSDIKRMMYQTYNNNILIPLLYYVKKNVKPEK